MALVISSENYKNNNIGPDNGGLQPKDASQLKNMRLNNGAPSRNGENDVINYDNGGEKNPWQDRVVSTENETTTTYTTARDATYFALHGTSNENDIDNNTEIGSVTKTGNFHYVAPQNKVVTDDNNYIWDEKGTEETEDDVKVDRISQINQIYQVGSVNAMSAR